MRFLVSCHLESNRVVTRRGQAVIIIIILVSLQNDNTCPPGELVSSSVSSNRIDVSKGCKLFISATKHFARNLVACKITLLEKFECLPGNK